MSTPQGSGSLPSARSNHSQALRTGSPAEGSAARCCVFRGRKQKLPKNEQLITAEPQIEYIPARNSINFQYSARNTVVDTSTFVVKTTTSTTREYGRNATLYLRYLEKKIKLITSKVDSYSRELDRHILKLRDKMSSTASRLQRIISLIEKKHKTVSDVERMLPFYRTKKAAYGQDLERRITLLKARKTACGVDINSQSAKLNSKLAPFSRHLRAHIKLLNSKIISHSSATVEKMKQLNFHYSLCKASVEKKMADFYF